MYSMRVLTASVEVGDGGGEGIPVLEMSEEEGELRPLHAEMAPLELVADAGERIRNAVELAGKLSVFIFEAPVAVYLGDGSQVVESACLFDEGVETSILTGEDGEEPRSCCLNNGVLSIVRPEEKLYDVGGFPRLPPGQ
jgi:hypothetical protein